MKMVIIEYYAFGATLRTNLKVLFFSSITRISLVYHSYITRITYTEMAVSFEYSGPDEVTIYYQDTDNVFPVATLLEWFETGMIDEANYQFIRTILFGSCT